jgi:CRP-like cAMP-binding protein
MDTFINDGQASLGPLSSVIGSRGFAQGILAALPRAELALLSPKLEFLRLKARQILHESDDVIQQVYFIEDGLLSVLNVQMGGKNVEVGVVGGGGFVGLPVIDGLATSPHRIQSHAGGAAHRIDATSFQEMLPHCPQLSLTLHRYAQKLMVHSMQLAACNALHEVEQRLARWLLISHELLGSMELPVTQDVLGQLLGTRRSSVTVAAGMLQKAGIVSCARGRITIMDLAKLESAACECYVLMKQRLGNSSIEPQAAA